MEFQEQTDAAQRLARQGDDESAFVLALQAVGVDDGRFGARRGLAAHVAQFVAFRDVDVELKYARSLNLKNRQEVDGELIRFELRFDQLTDLQSRLHPFERQRQIERQHGLVP